MRRLQRRKIGMVLYACDINRRVISETATPLLALRRVAVARRDPSFSLMKKKQKIKASDAGLDSIKGEVTECEAIEVTSLLVYYHVRSSRCYSMTSILIASLHLGVRLAP